MYGWRSGPLVQIGLEERRQPGKRNQVNPIIEVDVACMRNDGELLRLTYDGRGMYGIAVTYMLPLR
jgi:hypothetical protein